jgi:hypothetical protein
MDRSACGNWQRFAMWWVGLSTDGRAQTTTTATTTTTTAATAAKTETGSATATTTATATTGAEGGADDYSR